jgi:hypothetical protein
VLKVLRGHSTNKQHLKGWGCRSFTHSILTFFKDCFKAFGSENFCLIVSSGFSRYFHSYPFDSSTQIRKKIGDQKKRNVMRVGKVPQKCDVLFECPLVPEFY